MDEDDEAIDGAMLDIVEDSVDVDMLDCIDKREWYDVVVDVRKEGAGERKDEPDEAVVEMDEAVCEDATELRPGEGQLVSTRGRRAQHTAVHCLLEHPMDHVGAMSRQQGLDVSHRLLWDVHVVVHVGERDSDYLPVGVDGSGSDGAVHSLRVLPGGTSSLRGDQKRVKRCTGLARRWSGMRAPCWGLRGEGVDERVSGRWR